MPRARVLMGTPEFAKSRNERKKVEMPRGQAPHRSRSGRGSIGGLHCSTSVVDRRTRLAVGGVAFAVPEEGLVDVNNNRVLDVDQVIEPHSRTGRACWLSRWEIFHFSEVPPPPARGVPRALGAARAPDRGLGLRELLLRKQSNETDWRRLGRARDQTRVVALHRVLDARTPGRLKRQHRTWLMDKARRAFAFQINDAILVGDGFGKPMGILNPQAGIPIAETGSGTPAGQFSWQDLVMLRWQVPMSLQGDGAYLMNQTRGRSARRCRMRTGARS